MHYPPLNKMKIYMLRSKEIDQNSPILVLRLNRIFKSVDMENPVSWHLFAKLGPNVAWEMAWQDLSARVSPPH